MKNLFQKLTVAFSILGIICMIGCSKQQKVDDEAYVGCNTTSHGTMAETESGYFFVYDFIVYYADKDNLDLWVPVCSNPDCFHSTATGGLSGDEVWCNGYVESNRVIYKNGKIYDIAHDSMSMSYFAEITEDGTGIKKVYEVPWDEEDIPLASSQASYKDRVLLTMKYLDEKGYDKTRLISLEEDEKGEVVVHTLYEDESVYVMSGNAWWSIRGDDVVITDIDLGQGKNLWRNFYQVKGNELVKLEIPEDINLYYSYLSGKELTYYEQNDGFYKLNLETGEKQLIAKSQIEDGLGMVFSEELIFEYNCYSADIFAENAMVGNYPEHIWEGEMCIKMYDGTEWKDVQIPEELVSLNRSGNPRAMASDRIFFNFSTGTDYKTDLYYMMLDEKQPKLVYAGQILEEAKASQDHEEESTTGTEDTEGFKELIIFDNEDGVLKVTDAKREKEDYVIGLFFEEGDSGRNYHVTIEALINGIQCHTHQSLGTQYSEKGKVWMKFEEETLKEYGVTDIYSIDEFTDIELTFYVTEIGELKKEILEKSVHIYPQGEEAAVHYTREQQEGDIVCVDNENVKVTVIGYETTKVENDTPIFFIENKTDKEIKFKVDAGSVNGAQDNMIANSANEIIQGGGCAFVKAVFGYRGGTYNIKNFWDYYDITEIGTIKTLINLGYYDIGNYEKGDTLVEKLITLYPKGEENARHDARLPQETDVVLVDNEYIKITHVGYQDYEGFALDDRFIPDAYAKILVENKTDEILYSSIQINGNDGNIVTTGGGAIFTLLPGEYYMQVTGYLNNEVPTVSKIEFLYQVFDKEQNLLNQEYAAVYPLGKENAVDYQPDMSAMEDVVFENDSITIAVKEYKDISVSYDNFKVNFYLMNKTDKMLYFELRDIWVNGVELQISAASKTIENIVFAHGVGNRTIDVMSAVEDANMTELEEIEMTFNVYVYNYEDGTLGENLGSETVKFGPN